MLGEDAEDLPGWLDDDGFDSDDSALDWLVEDAPASGVLNWLEAEEEATKAPKPQTGPFPSLSTGMLGDSSLLGGTGPLNPDLVEQQGELSESQPLMVEYDLSAYAEARSAYLDGEFEAALEQYQSAFESGAELPVLAVELEEALM